MSERGAYNSIKSIRLNHETVNYDLHFTNRETRVHTQFIESYRVKQRYRQKNEKKR